MRKYLDIDLTARKITAHKLHAEEIVRAGRYHIVKTLLKNGVAKVDPLSPDNLLIFSAGPFAGTSFSNANRISVGCKSPLTGGIKEANGGGTFAYALGQLHVAGISLHGQADDWLVLHLKKDGSLSFDAAEPYLKQGNFAAAEMLYEHYGKKVAIGLCGPVGEYQGLLAGIAFSDSDGRPSRLAARGGVGAVMGNKKVKAIVVDLDKTPELLEPKKFASSLRDYAKMLRGHPLITKFYNAVGTMGMADFQNRVGGLPVNNFSVGTMINTDRGDVFKLGGDFISEQNKARGGKHTHACMPGCVIQCSNIYVDEQGKEVVSPLEYETIGLLGSNCGLKDPDDLAAVNFIANDLGIDTIETGATLAVLMEAGLAEFGDVDWMVEALAEIRNCSELGRLWAQGTARVGEHYGVKRVPVIKKQAISAYDPRVVEATGITMMVSAQGADHTAGNAPRLSSQYMTLAELMTTSLKTQIKSAANDSLGLCMFGGVISNNNQDFIAEAINQALGADLDGSFFDQLGEEVLRLEREFNQQAGFGPGDDELPEFFYNEPLAPTMQTVRFHSKDVQGVYDPISAENSD